MDTLSAPKIAAPSQATPNACGHSAFAPPAAVEGDRGNPAGLHPPLTAKERVGFAVMLAVCALLGAMLAIGGVL